MTALTIEDVSGKPLSPTRYRYAAIGNARFMQALADALEDAEPLLPLSLWVEDAKLTHTIPALRQNHTIRAFGVWEVAGTFTIFVISCFGKKIFDEFYDRVLKIPLTPFLDKLFPALGRTEKTALEMRNVVYLEDIDTTVVIRILVHHSGVASAKSWILSAHKVAHQYLQHHGRRAAIHCHTVMGGQVSLEPALFDSLEDLEAALGAKASGPAPAPRAPTPSSTQ